DNSNQHAVPHEIGVPGFWLAGDTTWPGLGTVACVHGSRLVAESILARWADRRPVAQLTTPDPHEEPHDAALCR
ncbi:MAG TPA: hypothetical protein VFW33_04530, partial [Gemmataceae bacterium]|nr:hypothetical protein [Gemmataceae bacterium]